MRRHGDFVHDLLIERHAAPGPAQRPQELIVVAFAPAQSAALKVEGYSGNED